jgi:hypothetical protein
MKYNKIFLFTFLAVVYWFLCGGPNFFEHPASLGYFGLGLIYLLCMLWTDSLFILFDGDSYTYGPTGKGIALFFGSPAVIIIALLVRVDSNILNIPTWLNNIGIGFILLGLLSILSVPIMTTNSVNPLPIKESRRNYNDLSVMNNQEDQDHV